MDAAPGGPEMKQGVKYGLVSFATSVLWIVFIVVYSNAHSAKLTADLDKARSDNASLRTALDGASKHLTELGAELQQLHGQLESANQQLAGQQRTIERQQSLIDAAKRGLAGLAETVANAGGDIRKQIHAFAEGFQRLYKLYHPGGS